jgi:putative toxin-antitoxin system antitoxin component (TIGR02293 family)
MPTTKIKQKEIEGVVFPSTDKFHKVRLIPKKGGAFVEIIATGEAPSVKMANDTFSGVVTEKRLPKNQSFSVRRFYAPKTPKPNSSEIIDSIHRGLLVSNVATLTDDLGVSYRSLAKKIGLSKATLHRRKQTGRLTADESDKTIRFARLFGKAVETFDAEEAARRWLSSPQVGLGGAIPLDYAETETGAREVENLLGRIEYGVYS